MENLPNDDQWTEPNDQVNTRGTSLFTKALRGLLATAVLGSVAAYGAISVKPELAEYLSFVPGLESSASTGSCASYSSASSCSEGAGSCPMESSACCVASDACPSETVMAEVCADGDQSACQLCPGSVSSSADVPSVSGE